MIKFPCLVFLEFVIVALFRFVIHKTKHGDVTDLSVSF